MTAQIVNPDSCVLRAENFADVSVRQTDQFRGDSGCLLELASRVGRGPLYYFQSRDREFELLGIGEFASFRAGSMEEFCSRWGWVLSCLAEHRAASHLFLLGGTSFDGVSPGQGWGEFSGVHFFLPRKIAIRRGDNVSVFLIGGRDDEELLLEEEGRESFGWGESTIAGWRGGVPTFSQWESTIGAALEEIRAGRIEKVVLARREVATVVGCAHPARLLKRLLEARQRVTGFAFAPSNRLLPCFFGATPELLFSMEGDLVQSEAVAGTAGIEKRGGEAGSLANLGPKERAEHQFVVSAVVDRLSQVSKDITWDKEPQIVPLHDLVHLVTPIRAALRQRVDPLEILGLLHPTPAVCGTPSAAAREFIRVHEPFDRGWYAGTIGYMNAERSEFAVSLRSALLEQESLSAFVGAGIVSGSVAASEWDELNLKQRRIEEMVANKG